MNSFLACDDSPSITLGSPSCNNYIWVTENDLVEIINSQTVTNLTPDQIGTLFGAALMVLSLAWLIKQLIKALET